MGAFCFMEEIAQRVSPLYGREEIVSRLRQRVEALKKGYRQNIGLVGPRGMGKTALLRYFLSAQDPELLPLYIPLTPTDFDGFVERWLGGLLQSFLTFQGMAFPEDFQMLVKTCRQFIPKTLDGMREAKKHAFQKKISLAFRELLGLTATLSQETGKKILLILDEFQNLESLELTDPFGLFGKEMMIQKDTLYLVTSSAPHKTHEIFHDRLSLLFGNFEVIEVGPLPLRGLRTWANEGYADLRIPDEDLRVLGHFLGNLPYYFQSFLESARALALQTPAFVWNRAFLFRAIEETLYSEPGPLNRYFESELKNLHVLARHPRPYEKVLLALAHGQSKLLPIAAYAGKKVPETKKLLQRLIGEGRVEKKGTFYCLKDALFRFWLRGVYQTRDRDLALGGERSRVYFRACLAEVIRKIEEEDRMDLSARVEALLREFRNDRVEMDQKKVVCPTFLEIAFRPTNGRFFPIFGRTSRGRWFCQVYREPVSESDVIHFTEELKHSRRKIQRKVMMTLGGIDLNAKLMAHEAGIQLWDLEDLNALLDLYGKQKLMVA